MPMTKEDVRELKAETVKQLESAQKKGDFTEQDRLLRRLFDATRKLKVGESK